MLDIHRTHKAKICNHSQVAESLDRHGWSASKLWNVGNYYAREQWDETGEIPDQEIANCDDAGGERATRLHATWSDRRTHFFHSLAAHIVERCIDTVVRDYFRDRATSFVGRGLENRFLTSRGGKESRTTV